MPEQGASWFAKPASGRENKGPHHRKVALTLTLVSSEGKSEIPDHPGNGRSTAT